MEIWLIDVLSVQYAGICKFIYVFLEINPILFTAELTLPALASLKKSENAN